jgi:hypothetical protein
VTPIPQLDFQRSPQQSARAIFHTCQNPQKQVGAQKTASERLKSHNGAVEQCNKAWLVRLHWHSTTVLKLPPQPLISTHTVCSGLYQQQLQTLLPHALLKLTSEPQWPMDSGAADSIILIRLTVDGRCASPAFTAAQKQLGCAFVSRLVAAHQCDCRAPPKSQKYASAARVLVPVMRVTRFISYALLALFLTTWCLRAAALTDLPSPFCLGCAQAAASGSRYSSGRGASLKGGPQKEPLCLAQHPCFLPSLSLFGPSAALFHPIEMLKSWLRSVLHAAPAWLGYGATVVVACMTMVQGRLW